MDLGKNVLNKIEQLLAKIDKPKHKKQPRPSRLQENQQMNGNVFQKLYNNSKTIRQKQEDKYRQQLTNQQKEMSKFKVSNKRSLFLLSLSEHKPLHERTNEILLQRQVSLSKLRIANPGSRDDEEQIIKEMEEHKRNEKLFTRKEVEEKMQIMAQKEKERLCKINQAKLEQMENYSLEFRCKPYMSKMSSRIWKQYRIKRDLSSSVFDRFGQYELGRKEHLELTERRIRKQFTPFQPKISDFTRELASKSPRKLRYFYQRDRSLEKSLSCKCFRRSMKKLGRSTALQTSRRIY